MSVTREELAAFADGELGNDRRAEVQAAIAADPDLAREVEAHRALRARLASHFAPILEKPLPEAMTAPLQTPNVIDLGAARTARSDGHARIPRWGWIAGPALAASLIIVLFVSQETAPAGYADQQLATALNDQLVATQPDNAPTQILLSFRSNEGAYCRVYADKSGDGIACKDAQGWRLQETVTGKSRDDSEYRQAGSPRSALMMKAQAMSDGPALNPAQEQSAQAKGWR
jgi:hypothetical protein